jgi:hypothetical protein
MSNTSEVAMSSCLTSFDSGPNLLFQKSMFVGSESLWQMFWHQLHINGTVTAQHNVRVCKWINILRTQQH